MADSTISDILKFKQKFEFDADVMETGESLFLGSRQILTNQEEANIVDWIHQLHMSNQYPSPSEVRLYTESLSTTRRNKPISSLAQG
jgi:hypothetical protein